MELQKRRSLTKCYCYDASIKTLLLGHVWLCQFYKRNRYKNILRRKLIEECGGLNLYFLMKRKMEKAVYKQSGRVKEIRKSVTREEMTEIHSISRFMPFQQKYNIVCVCLFAEVSCINNYRETFYGIPVYVREQ